MSPLPYPPGLVGLDCFGAMCEGLRERIFAQRRS